MSGQRPSSKAWVNWIRLGLLALGFSALVIVLMLWLSGKFSAKVPRTVASSYSSSTQPDWPPVAARLVRVPVIESAVGTIRAVSETAIASKLLGRVVELNLRAGQEVHQNDVLVRLDDTELRARLQQAEAVADSAKAVRDNAATEQARMATMLKGNVATQAEFDKADAALKTAEAEVRRADEAVKEATSLLDYTTIRAPMDGTVVDKKINVGDTAMPGQVLATLYDPRHMQLVASVRESLAYQLKVGQQIGVRVDVLNKTCGGEISEIVPEAQSASRTFQVKVTGPCPPGIYSGVFGRILIPLEDEEVLVIPQGAVHKVGQLELVDVWENGQVQRRAIRTGRLIEGGREVLSGLTAGEKVVVPTKGQGA